MLKNPQDVLDKFICYSTKKAKYPAILLKENCIGLNYVIEALRPGNMPIIVRIEETDVNGDPVCIELEKKIKQSPLNFKKLLNITQFDIQISDTEYVHVSSIEQLMKDTRYTWT